RAADDAGRSSCGGAEKRAATSISGRGVRRAGAISWSTGVARIGLRCDLAAVPDRPCRLLRPDIGHRSWASVLLRAKQSVTHAVEEAAGLRPGLCSGLQLRLELFDMCVGALQRFVLDEHGLHQRISRIR